MVTYRPRAADSARAVVRAALAELESVAMGLFPAWLPEATGIAGPGGAGVAAVRALAIHAAPHTAQFGPFLADLAELALGGTTSGTERFAAEVRSAGLAQVIARSYGRPAAALLVQVPAGLSDVAEQALVGGMEWLAQRGGFGIWLTGADGLSAEWIPEVKVHLPEAVASIERTAAARPAPGAHELPPVAYPPIAGRPHPQSRVEQALEAALSLLPWAVGRAWNQTYRARPLEPPVRLDLLWREERCVVEIDGPEHADPVRYEADRRRDVQLQLDGFVVLRFTNDQVAFDLALVICQIEQLIRARRRTIAEGCQNARQG
jgi:very-short-patch-repair endonuclease